jgi:hypothetical protein
VSDIPSARKNINSRFRKGESMLESYHEKQGMAVFRILDDGKGAVI